MERYPVSIGVRPSSAIDTTNPGRGGLLGALAQPESLQSLRRLRMLIATVVAISIAALFLAVTVVPLTGAYATFIVLTQSMEPTIHQGSIVIVSQRPADQVRVGDIITFTSTVPPYSTLTHRVLSIYQGDDGLAFQTKGDANLLIDPWKVSYSGQAGLVRVAIPLMGYVLAWVATSGGRLGLGLLLAAMIAAFTFSAIWLKPRALAAFESLQTAARGQHITSGPISPVRLLILAWLLVALVVPALASPLGRQR